MRIGDIVKVLRQPYCSLTCPYGRVTEIDRVEYNTYHIKLLNVFSVEKATILKQYRLDPWFREKDLISINNTIMETE